MGKDPAVLFYTQDFLVGTMMMTDEQVGQYIRLLCLQHQKGGYLTKKDMIKICGSDDPDIFSKFKITSDGLYFNQRMLDEVDKRKAYSESRAKNRRKDINKISKTYDNHMENEIENEDVIKDEPEIASVKEPKKPKTNPDFIDQILLIWSDEYMKARGISYVLTNKGKDRMAIGNLIKESKIKNENQSSDEMLLSFRAFFKECLNIQEKFIFENIAPSLIWNQFNKINNILSNGKAKQFNTAQQFSDIDFTIFNKK